jgi:hypothetical protein
VTLRVHDVPLEPGAVPVFPDACVVCQKASPAHAFWYVTRDGAQGRRLWRGWLARRVPACSGCGLRVQLGLAWSFVRTVVVGLGSTVLVLSLLHGRLPELALALTCFGITCGCLVALVVWERTHPPVFSIEPTDAADTYRFRERAPAERFARANGLAAGGAFGD